MADQTKDTLFYIVIILSPIVVSLFGFFTRYVFTKIEKKIDGAIEKISEIKDEHSDTEKDVALLQEHCNQTKNIPQEWVEIKTQLKLMTQNLQNQNDLIEQIGQLKMKIDAAFKRIDELRYMIDYINDKK